jgi:hypothetical protein
MLPLFREMFPGKLMLTVEDVARVLRRTGAGGYEQTREQLANGVIVPGLRKMGGQWLVPIAALADALDSLVDLDSLGRTPPARHRRTADVPDIALVKRLSPAWALLIGKGLAHGVPRAGHACAIAAREQVVQHVVRHRDHRALRFNPVAVLR